jgi:iron(III) transport system ATP-binding protein
MGRVSVAGVAKAFGPKQVLKDLSLSVEDGECFTLLGPSGCGKTVLLRLVAGFESLDAGAIHIGGRLVSGHGVNEPPEARNLGVVFQDYAVWPHLTVRRNTAYPLKFKGGDPEGRVQTVLDQVGLGALGERYPSQLSGGQQQRVALARALVARPDVMLLDEPLSNLDANLREEMRFEIKGLQRHHGATILYVTHDQEVALALSDRIGILDQGGALRQVGTPRDIYEHPADLNVFRFMGVTSFVDLERDGDRAVVAGTPVDLRPDWGLACAGPVLGGFRPTEAELVLEGGVPGIVRRVALLGPVVDFRVELGGRETRIQQETSEVMRGCGLPVEGQACRVRFHRLRAFEAAAVDGEA